MYVRVPEVHLVFLHIIVSALLARHPGLHRHASQRQVSRNCICHKKYYSLVCDHLEGPVSDYSDQIRNWGFPPLACPSRDCLIGIVTRTFWLKKGDDLPVRDPSSDLLLHWPLPPCFHSMHKNINLILSGFADLELEVYGRSFRATEEGTLNYNSLPPVSHQPTRSYVSKVILVAPRISK
jgi:hypothetical protein